MAVAPDFSRKLMAAALMLGLLVLVFRVMQPFLAPIAWAGILVFVTWPLYQRLLAVTAQRRTVAALVMTVGLAAVLVLPMAWIVLMLQSEVGGLYKEVAVKLASGSALLPDSVRQLPYIGVELEQFLDRMKGDPEHLRAEIAHYSQQWRGALTDFVGGVGRNIAKLGFAILTAFFLYRDGDTLVRQMRIVIARFVGARTNEYFQAVGETTRAVVYGIVLTAIGQGFLAGLGYWWAGLDSPVFLGAITGLIALIPFGTPFAWGSIAVWLMMSGHFWEGAGLFAWGTFVVSWVDNIIRPLVISNATQIPFVLVMFGVLGGLASFGMVGLFVGPVLLAVLVAVWREWLEDQQALHDAQEEPEHR